MWSSDSRQWSNSSGYQGSRDWNNKSQQSWQASSHDWWASNKDGNVTGSVTASKLVLPSHFKSDDKFFDSSAVGSGNHQFHRVIQSTDWSRKAQLAGRSVEDLRVHELCFRGMSIREMKADVDAVALECIKEQGFPVPDKHKQAASFMEPLVDVLLKEIKGQEAQAELAIRKFASRLCATQAKEDVPEGTHHCLLSAFTVTQVAPAAAYAIQLMLNTVWNGLDLSLPEIWRRIHHYLQDMPSSVDLLEFNDDLVGFFNSVPREMIISALQLLIRNYQQKTGVQVFTIDLRKSTASAQRALPHKPRGGRSGNIRVLDAQHLVCIAQLSFRTGVFVANHKCLQQIRGTCIGNQISPVLSSLPVILRERMWKQYPVDERFPVNPLRATDCESSVASDISIGPPIEWVGRAAWLSEQTKRWQNVPTPELQEYLRHILSLLPREVISSENQRLWQMQPSVVLTFCRARVAAKLPYTSVFRNTAKVWAANDRIVWEFETHGMPGPALAPTTASTAHYRWFHCAADLTLIRLCTAGRMLRTCSETVGMQPGETPYAFFGRAGFDTTPRENARKVADPQSHGQNRTGVIVSGRLCTSHHEMMGASTYWETLQCKEHELVRGTSSDKRWAIRESSAAVDRFYLVCVRPPLTVRVPTWPQLLSDTAAPTEIMSCLMNAPIEDWW
eukprot:s273_g21.t2